MPRLGKELDAETMSLYRHVNGRHLAFVSPRRCHFGQRG
jgi:hypothetical protein